MKLPTNWKRFELALAKDAQRQHLPATFGLAADLYAKWKNPRKWDATCLAKLVAVIGEYQLSDIRQRILVDAANTLYPHASNATKNRQVIGIAAAVLHYAAENNLCPYIVVRKFEEKTPEPRAVSKEVAKVLLNSTTGPMHVILTWWFYQGWRISDTLRVQWSDLNLSEQTVRYHISKTDDYRLMPLHPKTVAAIATMTPGVGRVFPWQNKSNFYRAWKPIRKRLGIKFTPHMARHSFASWLASEGVSPLELMEAGGWKDHKSVIRYAKLDPTRVRRTINKLV
jgi:integrase